MPKTKIKASQVVEDTLEDKDGNTKVSVETSTNEDKIRFTTGGTERMIITDDGKVGIGNNITPGYKLDVDGDIKIRGGDIRDNSGGKVIEMDGNGFLKFTNGQKYAKGVLVSSASSPSAAGGNPDGGWIKFAVFDTDLGTQYQSLDTAASTFMVMIAGQESANNRALDGTFLVTAKFTVNQDGQGTDNASISNAYYEPEGTYIYCEPLNADRLSAAGVNAFEPSTDLLMIFENNVPSPTCNLYIRACAKGKRCFVTHLGGTGLTDTSDTNLGFTTCTGQAWSATEPTTPANNVKITGTWASKVFSKLGIGTSSPDLPLHVVGNTRMEGNLGIGTSNPQCPLHLEVQNGAGDFFFASNKNSINQNDGLGNFFFVGTLDNGSSYKQGASIHATAAQNWNAGSDTYPTNMEFKTCSGNSLATRMTIASGGDITIENKLICASYEASSVGINATAGSINFQASGSTNMTIEQGGDVGIGITNPNHKLQVRGASGSNAVFQIETTHASTGSHINAHSVLDSDPDFNCDLIKWEDAVGDSIYVVQGNGSGGSSVLTSFTGSHDTVVPISADLVPGLIVESTGVVWHKNTEITYETALPKCQLTTVAGSKTVFGVIAGFPVSNEDNVNPNILKYVRNGFLMRPAHTAYARLGGLLDNEHHLSVHALGEGVIWVTNINGAIENGDYIESSNIRGIGQKQPDDILRSKTVAKCIEAIDWEQVTDTIEHDGVAYKKYLTSCTYHCG